jgi:hypothetical protein
MNFSILFPLERGTLPSISSPTCPLGSRKFTPPAGQLGFWARPCTKPGSRGKPPGNCVEYKKCRKWNK